MSETLWRDTCITRVRTDRLPTGPRYAEVRTAVYRESFRCISIGRYNSRLALPVGITLQFSPSAKQSNTKWSIKDAAYTWRCSEVVSLEPGM
jgi:hypothetical protein